MNSYTTIPTLLKVNYVHMLVRFQDMNSVKIILRRQEKILCYLAVTPDSCDHILN